LSYRGTCFPSIRLVTSSITEFYIYWFYHSVQLHYLTIDTTDSNTWYFTKHICNKSYDGENRISSIQTV